MIPGLCQDLFGSVLLRAHHVSSLWRCSFPRHLLYWSWLTHRRLKIFSSEFYAIGALFAIYGTGILLVSLYRRAQGNKAFFSEIGDDGLNRKVFRTSGNVVIVLAALSLAAYVSLLVLTLRLET